MDCLIRHAAEFLGDFIQDLLNGTKRYPVGVFLCISKNRDIDSRGL